MDVYSTVLTGVLVIEPKVFKDERGFFLETFQKKRYEKLGIQETFVQDNLSYSKRNTIRGLHYQFPQSQGKLIYVLSGEVFDVVVDIRKNSPTFGKWYGEYLSGENKKQLWIPAGFAHGFCVTSEEVLFGYKCTDYYNPDTERSIKWNDADIGVNWPVNNGIISEKDNSAKLLKDISSDLLPAYNHV